MESRCGRDSPQKIEHRAVDLDGRQPRGAGWPVRLSAGSASACSAATDERSGQPARTPTPAGTATDHADIGRFRERNATVERPGTAALARPENPIDPQEPNDDVRYVKAGGISRAATPPLTTARRTRGSLTARLDASEDPEDVYRVWVPAQRVVRFASAAAQDVDLDVWRPTTASVLVEGAARRRFLLGSSTRRGSGAERVTVRAYGNVFAAVALLHGLAQEDLQLDKLEPHDPDYEVLITVRAVKQES